MRPRFLPFKETEKYFFVFIYVTSISLYAPTLHLNSNLLQMDLGSFNLLAIVNNAAINMSAQIFLTVCFNFIWLYAQNWTWSICFLFLICFVVSLDLVIITPRVW